MIDMNKKIENLLLCLVMGTVLASCDFDTQNYQQKPADEAYQTVKDVRNGMNGAYQVLGSSSFLGCTVQLYNDVCSDVTLGSYNTGHFNAQSSWVISENDYEMEFIWEDGYKIIDRCTRTIQSAKNMLAKAEELHLDSDETAELQSYMAQCHAVKALAYHYLVNFFCYPYHKGTENLGLPLVKDKPIEPFESIRRATVGETYQQITDDLAEAERLTEECGIVPNAFYMGDMGIQALKARVYLAMGNYEVARKAALKAIELKGNGDGTGDDYTPTDDNYISMWTSLAITDEDLFTIAKSEADNLGASSLNTYYDTYCLTFQYATLDLFGENDIRQNLIMENQMGLITAKFQGLPTSAMVSNIPIFRKSEMSLIVAEAEARAGNIEAAQNYLFYTAKRDKDLTAADQLPGTTEDLLAFIADERVREFAGEGHRFMEARRMGLELYLQDFANPFDIANFVFPIPASEINAGFCTEQNENWQAGLPE